MMGMRAMELMAEARRRELVSSAQDQRDGKLARQEAGAVAPARVAVHRAPRQRVGSWLILAGTRLGGASIRTS
jgi:hypothetical protein